MPTVTILPANEKVECSPGTELKEVLKSYIAFPCAGSGVCGGCRIRFLEGAPEATPSEKRLLSPDEIKEGIRLACQHRITSDCTVLVPQSLPKHPPQLHMPQTAFPIDQPIPIDEGYSAVDVGTSTVYMLIKKGKSEKIVSFWNPQHLWGSDVISRLNHALNPTTREAMRDALLKRIEENLKHQDYIDALSIAGNPVITGILAEEDLSGLAHYPFTTGAKGFRNITVRYAKQSILLPEIGGFLGSDALSLLLASIMQEKELPFLAMDVGTNTEMFIITEETLYGTSTPAGPVFEGFGIKKGTPAVEGAIYEVEEDLTFHTIGNKGEIGFCGSGLISAVHALKKRGFVTSDGALLTGEKYSFGHIFIHQQDIRKLQLAKAAIYAAASVLLEKARVLPEEVKAVFIAGNFGSALKKEWLIELKFLPNLKDANFTYLGNTSLWGAKWSILSKQCRQDMETLKNRVSVIQLAEEEQFQELYLKGMEL